MKISFTKSFVFLFALSSCTLSSCLEQCEEKEKTTFSGTVKTVSRDAVEGALVQINEDQIKTDPNGAFKLVVDAVPLSFMVSVEKFGYGLFSKTFEAGFENRKITLTQGTIVEFDPTIDNIIADTNSVNNISQSALLKLDTSQLFSVVPKVYDYTGKLVDLGYPEEVKGIFDYVKTPRTTRRGMSMRLRANSLRNASGNLPPAGKKLKAAVTTIDFFNPDGMPGNFTVRFKGDPQRFNVDTTLIKKTQNLTSLQQAKSAEIKPADSTNAPAVLNSSSSDNTSREQLAYMESFGAATIDISDGEEPYQLEEGMTATVTIPVYSIRQEKNEFIPPAIPLLHYNESDGVWEVTGQGILNEAGDAYVGEVGHFSVVNFDMVKTGDSKCFKIRQKLKLSAIDNIAGLLSTYRVEILVPETATSSFDERDRLIDESTGCVAVDGTSLHGVSRIDNAVPYVVTVFSQDGIADTLNIAITQAALTSIPAETAVTTLGDCSSATCLPADITNCESTDDAIDADPAIPPSLCNTCWMPDCALIPFENLGSSELRIVGVPMGNGKVKVKWVNVNSFTSQSMRINAYTSGNCGGGGTEIFSVCSVIGCMGVECQSGELIYPAVGTATGTVSFDIEIFSTPDCTGIAPPPVCSDDVIVIP